MRKIMGNPCGAQRLVVYLLAAALYGCTLGPVEQNAPHTFLLNPDIAVGTISPSPGRPGSLILLVSQPRAQAGFETARMAYLRRPHEVSYYAFNQWADTPARMFSVLLTQTMEKAGLWHAVVQAPSAARADYRLDCDNLVLEQQFFSNPSRVRVALLAQLIDHRRQNVIGTRNFEIFEAAPSEDAYGGVIAANRAAAGLLAEVTAWVTAVISESGGSSRVIGTKGE
jgi:cholesterol transport system auxiliary component